MRLVLLVSTHQDEPDDVALLYVLTSKTFTFVDSSLSYIAMR